MNGEVTNNLDYQDREVNEDDEFENLPPLNINGESYYNIFYDSLLEPSAPSIEHINSLNSIVPATTTASNMTVSSTAKFNDKHKIVIQDKYSKYQFLNKKIKDKENLNTYDGSEDVKKVINSLRNDLKRKYVKCTFCKKKKSIDIVFRHAETTQVIRRECAKKGSFERKKDLLDYVEEEPNELYCFRCSRCHKYREMNQFQVKKWKKVNKITYCKFCSNIRYLTS